jgi:L-asparaginase
MAMVRRVGVIFTGGTISMRHDHEAGGPVPVLRGAEILASVPDLETVADTEAIDWGLIPASHLSFEQVIDLAATVRRTAVRPDVHGIVVVQGTDTLEETAFALDLLLSTEKPVVVVGAMRNASQDGYDGPGNLRDAVRCAASPLLSDQGVLVAMAGEIHGADDVAKTHSDAYATFQSPNFGRLGIVDGAGIHVARRRTSRTTIEAARAEPVALVTVALGLDASIIDLVRQAGARGIVVAATGAGNTHPAFVDRASAAIEAGVPVVLTTRCPSGRARPAYGFPGGGVSWQRAGAVFGGFLGGLKARVLLSLALGAGEGVDEIRAHFEAFS